MSYFPNLMLFDNVYLCTPPTCFIINQATFNVAYMCIRYCWCIIIDIFNNEQVREIDTVATLRACNSN